MNKKAKVVPMSNRQQKRHPEKVNMQQVSQMLNPEQVMNEILTAKLEAGMFEMTPEQRERIAYVQDRARLLSIVELSGDLPTYRRLIAMERTCEMTLMDASYFINGASKLSPSELGMSLEEYADFIASNDQVVIAWNTQVLPLRTEAMEETQKQMTQAAPKIIAPEPKKIILPNT